MLAWESRRVLGLNLPKPMGRSSQRLGHEASRSHCNWRPEGQSCTHQELDPGACCPHPGPRATSGCGVTLRATISLPVAISVDCGIIIVLWTHSGNIHAHAVFSVLWLLGDLSKQQANL